MRRSNEIRALIAFLVCVWIADLHAQTATLSLPSVSATPGSRVSMRVALTGGAAPSGLQWIMDYPESDLKFEGAQVAFAAAGSSKSVQCLDKGGRAACLVIGLNRNTIPTGDVALVRFGVSSAARTGSLSVALSGVFATSPEATSIPIVGFGDLIMIDPDAGSPPPTITGVLDAASFQEVIAPGSMVSVFGAFAETSAAASEIPLSTELGGLSLTFNGIPGALFAVFGDDAGLGFNQANVQVPWELSLDGDPVHVRAHRTDANGESRGEAFEVRLRAASPAIFEFPIGSGRAVVTNVRTSPEDGVIASSLAQPTGVVDPAVGQPALVGGAATIWCNGLGHVTPSVPTGSASGVDAPLSEPESMVRVLIGGVEAQIIGRAVLHPTLVALNQINVLVPDILPGGAVSVSIEVDLGDGAVIRSKEGVSIAVRAAL